jgi:hypothetical protein
MLAAIKHLSDQTGDIFLPPSITTPDYPTVISAIERDRTARIAKLAIFIFSTAVTMAVTVLSEIGVIAGLWTLPALLMSIACWGIFYRLYSLESAYLENAGDSIRQDLAKQHLERLFFETSIENVSDLKELRSMFAHINALLDVDIFTDAELQRFARLDLTSCANKTLFEVAQEQGVDLSFNLEMERDEPGRFGYPPCSYKASIHWDGNKDNPIMVTKKCNQTKNCMEQKRTILESGTKGST